MKLTRRRAIQILAAIPFTVLAIRDFQYSGMLFVVVTALGGAFYCGYFCPFGFLQEIMREIGDKLRIKKRVVPKKLDAILKCMRYILYGAIALFSFGLVMRALEYDPRANLYMILTGKTITITMVISILVFCIISLFYDKVFCRYFCVSGARYGLLNLLRIFSIKRDENKCVNCKRCDKVCDMGIMVSTCKGSVSSPSCINCYKCIKACPVKGTLSYGLVDKKKLIVRLLLLAMVSTVYVWSNFDKIPFLKENVGSSGEEKTVTTKYTGVGEGYNGPIEVEVTLNGDKIVGIQVTKYVDDYEWYVLAEEGVIKSIIENQSTEVDVVSGASYSSRGIIDGVKDALSKKE